MALSGSAYLVLPVPTPGLRRVSPRLLLSGRCEKVHTTGEDERVGGTAHDNCTRGVLVLFSCAICLSCVSNSECRRLAGSFGGGRVFSSPPARQDDLVTLRTPASPFTGEARYCTSFVVGSCCCRIISFKYFHIPTMTTTTPPVGARQ